MSKRFRLYHEQFTSLKERIFHGGRVPYEEFWALKEVGFTVEEGTTFGLLGHNGSGKSTLLKAVAGIILPTSGEIVTRGRVTALLELGAGFQPELSGRENIYLNASLLGLSRSYVDRYFDDIVNFAELEPFIDNQVKYYSSGMYVRLGFSVAVHMDPDILIVDEVLSVGDELFQRKCLERVRQFQAEGRTIVVVTHAPDLVRQVCDQAAVLDHGMLVGFGPPAEAIRSFREHLLRRQAYVDAESVSEFIALTSDPAAPEAQPAAPGADTAAESAADGLNITHVEFDYPGAPGHDYAITGESLTIRIGYRASRDYDDVMPSYAVYDSLGRTLFSANTKLFPTDIDVQAGEGEFIFEIETLPLLDGDYPVTVSLLSDDEATVYAWHDQKYTLHVMNPTEAQGVLFLPTRVTQKVTSATETATP